MTNTVIEVEPAEDRKGRKRAFIALGSLLAVGTLATSAFFTDFALLDLNGSGGFGASDSLYNIQVSSGLEKKVGDVTTWVEANPDSASIANIPGASGLVPGGSVVVAIPVKNASTKWGSTLSVQFKNTNVTDSSVSAAQQARDAGYMKLISLDVAEVDDASTEPTTWKKRGLTVPTSAGGSSTTVDLSNLAATKGKVLYVKVKLNNGDTQADTDAANGGTASLQAVVKGTSVSGS